MKKRIMLLTMFLLLAGSVLAANDFDNQVITKGKITTFQSGTLNQTLELPVLTLKGTYYEMGLQYGVLLRDQIREVFKLFAVIIDSVPTMESRFSQMEQKLPQKYRDELRGIAKGSGLTYRQMVFLAYGAGRLEPSCTVLYANLGDRVIHGRNFDYDPSFLGDYPVVVQYNPPGEQSYTNFGVVSYPGFFNGINQNGISITLNFGAGTYDPAATGLPMGLQLREILCQSRNLRQAEKLLRNYQTDHIGWILGIESAKENKAAIFDVYHNCVKKTEIGERKYLYEVNRIFSPYRYGNNAEASQYLTMSTYGNRSNVTRGTAVERILAQNEVKDINTMFNLLSDANFWGYDRLIGTGGTALNYERTLNSMVFDLKNNTVYYAAANGFSPWARIYRLNTKDMSISLYRDELPERKSVAVKELLDWVAQYQILLYRRDYQGIFAMTDFDKELTPTHLDYLYRCYQKAPNVEWANKLIGLADKLSAKYSDYSLPYQIKGKILYREGKEMEAALYLEKALDSRIHFEDDDLRILIDLVQIYQSTGNQAKARHFMECFTKIYNKLAPLCKPDQQFQDKYEVYQKLLSNME